MKLGLQLGYWGAAPIPDAPALIAAAEAAGYDAVFTAESWGSDAYTPLAWWGSQTSTIKLGTGIAQLSARPPTSAAMHALTLDHLSGGRHILGLGVSGPQVVEGWYGEPFAKPLARTREYVQVIRDVLAREGRVTNAGPHYPLPYPADAPGSTGLGKSLKPITHPLRADLPIWLGAEGPKNVALSAEIADGWLAIYYTPRLSDMYEEWLAEGFARAGARRTRDTFEVAATVQVEITDNVAAVIDAYRPSTALYVGGMGAKEQNFHAEVYRRMGYADVVQEIGEKFLSGRKEEAIAAVPDEMVLETLIVGDEESVRGQIKRWEQAGVSMLMVTTRDVEQITRLGALV
ncbi:LLM class F420-dependent oxidoreductase [Williamsia sp. 1135]|uniref:LLM class F420-dependent oxidoreductase n=1 Tax=Williamsia sp. 1135 TaxID=1889262 RepID=UPI000A10BFAA|nr:LLM class F420-dependent oxidoreductase [Williamsia sp. 1135]ORM35133.1 LLM class F420-dependent oxidoreductase [Williamsia sp. 1135]